MTIASPHRNSFALPVALRLALRELRGGVRGFYVFITCLAIGVGAIAGVGSFAGGLAEGLAREGRIILGGDVSFSLIHREASPIEREFLASQGEFATAATMRALARSGSDQTALVEIKAVDSSYPLFGAVRFQPEGQLNDLLRARDGVHGALADPTLMARLDLMPGARVNVGNTQIEIRGELLSEPDKLAGGIGFGPRLLLSIEGLRATGLIEPGSLVRWHYRLRLANASAGDGDVRALIDNAHAKFPEAGWDIRSRNNASPALGRNIERFTQYLTLVGLTALLVGGVGIANAVSSYLDRKRDVIATMKALGAPGSRIFGIYLWEIGLLALIGVSIGLLIGAVLPFAVASGLGAIIPIPLAPSIQWDDLALAALYGFLTSLAFALLPLGRAHDVPVSALFRDEVVPQWRLPRWRYIGLLSLIIVVLALAAIMLAYDRRVAAIFVGAAVVVVLALRLVAMGVIALARRAPRPRSSLLRLAIANIYRPGALTTTLVLSLGLGLAVLVTLALIDGNLRRQFEASLPERAPAFYFIDIPAAEGARFDAFIRERANGAALERVPMLRGRIVSANGVAASDLKPPQNIAWVLQSDRGISYGPDVPMGSRVVSGSWWKGDYSGPPLVSLEKRIADGLSLTIGDPLVVNVLGRNITARVDNLRTVDWQSLGINFVMVFSPGAFAGAPHSDLATLTFPDRSTNATEIALLKAVADAFPTVTVVRVKEALEAVGKVVSDLALAIRAASAVALVSAALVLGGALAAGHRHRVYDAVVMRTIGATRLRLLGAYAAEYLMLGLATAFFGVAAGTLAAFLVVTELMNLSFVFLPAPALAAASGALALTLVLGLVGTLRVLGRKPSEVLRGL